MCRMFAYVGTSHREAVTLLDALKEASRKDLVGKKQKLGNECTDGWGYVLLMERGVDHYRTSNPIFLDDHKIPEFDGKVYAIFHSRAASDKGKVGRVFTHPFVASTPDKLIFLAHNGKVDMNGYANPGTIDTEYVLKVIVTKGIEAGIEELKLKTETGLNLLMLSIAKSTNTPSLTGFNYYVDPNAGPYFDLLSSRMKNGIAVVSSTLVDHGIKVDGIVPYDRLFEVEDLGSKGLDKREAAILAIRSQ